LDIKVDAIAGASIGALNGAVLASADDLATGAASLGELWEALAEDSPLQINWPVVVRMAVAAGATLMPVANAARLAGMMLNLATAMAMAPPVAGAAAKSAALHHAAEAGLASDAALHKMLERFLNPDALDKGLPLYISLYESPAALISLFEYFLAGTGLRDTRPPIFMHVQSRPLAEQRDCLLASAALPLIFQPRELDGKKYVDGGIGGRASQAGNTPHRPLIEAGCNVLIVTHLDDGSFWSRQDASTARVIEIRPTKSITRSGGIQDLLSFDAKKLRSWVDQGYDDTMHCVGRVLNNGVKITAMRHAEGELIKSVQELNAPRENLDVALDAMRRIKAADRKR
jgi:NTE family protein